MKHLLLIALLLAASPAWATDYTVCSTGTYTTPGAFVAAVAGGAGHNGLHCDENFGAVSISSSKTSINLKADIAGTAHNAVDDNHAVTPAHPIYDGGGVTGTALSTENGWQIVGIEIRNYTDTGRKPDSGSGSWNCVESSYLHDIGNSTAEWCWKNTADRGGTLAANTIFENCYGYGWWQATGGTNYAHVNRLSIINPGNDGLLYAASATLTIAQNILVVSASGTGDWGVDMSPSGGICEHCTAIGNYHGIRARTVRYSIAGDNASFGVCSGVAAPTECVSYGNANDWGLSGSGCNTSATSSSTTAPTYVDTTDYVPCTGSSPDGLSGSSTTTIDIGNNARTNPEDAGAWEAVACGPPAGSLGKRVTGGTLGKRVTGGVLGKRVD